MKHTNVATDEEKIAILPDTLDTTVCVIGAGPGGAFLALQLAKQGIKVILVEKAKSFQREFRGESLSPDARILLDRNGVGECFTQHGFVRTSHMTVSENGKELLKLDITGENPEIDYFTDFPQPLLLQSLIEMAQGYPSFTFLSGTAPRAVLRNAEGQVTGVQLANRTSECRVNCQLVVAADGRFSSMRKLAGVEATITKVPRDFLWFALPCPEGWEHAINVKIKDSRQIVLLPTYPNGLRAGFNIPPGTYGEFRRLGLDHFHQVIADLEPRLAEVAKTAITSWKDVHILDIFTSEMDRWCYDGLVFIGDSAHTITPVMGQGVKMSLFDADALSKVIVARLAVKPKGLFLAREMKSFEDERRKGLRFTARFQKRQEKLFRIEGRFRTAMRRGFYRTVNRMPAFKRRIIRNIYYSGLSQMEK